MESAKKGRKGDFLGDGTRERRAAVIQAEQVGGLKCGRKILAFLDKNF